LLTHYLGIGIENTTPTAYFHIYNPLPISPYSLFKTEATVGGVTVGSIKHLYSSINGDTTFGIYQTGLSLLNYFQGPIGSYTGMYFDGPNTGILIRYTAPFTFNMQAAPQGPIHSPLMLYNFKLKVNDTLECNNFLLHNSAGVGRILVSDKVGNGTWTDPSGYLPDYWQLLNGNVYLNSKYSNVGIGTNDPAQALHIVDGNILLSASSSSSTGTVGGTSVTKAPIKKKGSVASGGILAPNSKNGSILFGDAVTDKNKLGEWGIEYETNNSDYSSNGLNFWKPYSAQNGGGDNYLYLRNDGNIGIGTYNTCGYKLAVKGKILCTELKVQLETEWCDYIFGKDYKLKPLNEVEAFIKTNHHLKDVPSTDEVQTNGVNLGEMNATLLKKVEELTLYAIDQQKQIINQQNRLMN
jgi:hypothetical protein